MKKILALGLSLIMILSAFGLCASATEEKEEWSKYPLIMVPGYTSTSMYMYDENGNQVEAWGDLLGLIGGGLGSDSLSLLEQLAKSIAAVAIVNKYFFIIVTFKN